MDFPTAKSKLDLYKGLSLLFATLFGLSAVIELVWPGSIPLTVDEKSVGPEDSLAYYGSLWIGVLIGIAALSLFWWLHRRVHRVVADELGLQIIGGPVGGIAWSEVSSVKKTLSTFLSGFYLISLVDGTSFYTPIEREPPRFSTLDTWYDAPTSLEQLCKSKSVWVL